MGRPIPEPRSVACIMEAESKARKERAAVTLERRMKENVMMKANWCYQLKLASRYLGLRPAKMKGNERYMSDRGVTIPTEEGASARPPPTESSQLEQQQHVIFLAIDVSKPTITLGQGKKKKITEIGISTLATSDLAIGRARGEGEACAVEWFKKIRTRNFKIREWSNIRETDLVLGYEDNFKKELGNSEWISVHNAPKLIASCFGHASPVLDGSSSVNSPPTRISSIGVVVAPEEEKCNIIVVGHRIEKKISELRDIIGFDVTKLGNVITKKGLDVMDMFRALQQNPKTRTLCSLFHELDKPIQTKANPGNDSHYTLQVMIRICLKSCDAKYRTKMAQERVLRMQEKASQALEDWQQELAEWEQVEGDNDNDDDDGGEPVPIKVFLNKN